jgi:uncharacterized protein (DUF1499 family)
MSKVARRVLLLIGVLVIIQLAMTIVSWRSPREMSTSPQALSRCPDSPNCVSSVDQDPQHRVEPLQFGGEAAAAFARLQRVIARMPRTKIVTITDVYLHATFTTMIMRYTDDVEFLLDGETGTIAVRSASRVGYSDLGANRKRVERIRAAFNASE